MFNTEYTVIKALITNILNLNYINIRCNKFEIILKILSSKYYSIYLIYITIVFAKKLF